ncbi:MAG: YdiU family protein [Blastomonas sp.]
MTAEPQDSSYRPDPQIQVLGIGFPVKSANFPKTILRYRNDRAAETVGLAALSDSEWIEHFGRFVPLPGNLEQPLALAYHGHQFRVYNPEIGDGRGFLFAQMRDAQNQLMDLGTKGSGVTPFSRSGDGRLTLKGAVREILATEMLEALGVDTSKTFSVIETGEALMRNDEPSPTRSAVLVRLSHSHIRFGSFQRLAALEDKAELERLVLYCLDQFHGGMRSQDNAALLIEKTVEAMAPLAASYMVAGFVHGVLNTDNMNITGESFDYGPWRFTPQWEPGFTAAYFDHAGLYCFARQPEAIHWNLGQLAVALRLISDAPPLIAALERFGPLYQRAMVEKFCWRLGVRSKGVEEDRVLIETSERLMRSGGIGIDRFFFDWMGGAMSERPADIPGDPEAEQAWQALAGILDGYECARQRNHSYWQGDAPQSMHIEEVESIWDAIAERDDWQPLHDKIAAVRAMGEALS